MNDPQQEKLDELGETIAEVRRDAEDHGTIPESDDQTLADPDGDGDVEETPVQPPG